MEAVKSEFIKVAKVSAVHGLRGEVKIIPLITPPKMLRKISTLYPLSETLPRELHVTAVRPGPKGLWVLQVREWETVTEAEKAKGAFLTVPRESLPELPRNTYYLADLIGCRIVSGGEELGRMVDVLQTGANDVYVIEMPDGKQFMLPAVREFVKKVDIEKKIIDVVLPDGLLEI